MQYKIWDLDGTVINSSHRYSTLPNGDIDLPKWRADNTKENIERDSLLPLARLMRSNWNQGSDIVIICTARVLGVHDHCFLADHGLKANYILSRAFGDNRGDAEMKRAKLFALFASLNVPFARWSKASTFYDDNLGVLSMAKALGIRTRNATTLNEEMRSIL
jgi:hypothetical protein